MEICKGIKLNVSIIEFSLSFGPKNVVGPQNRFLR